MDDLTKIYNDLLKHAICLITDHQRTPEMVAGTMMAIAQRIYRTQMNEDEYNEMMKFIQEAPVRPYNIPKNKLH